MTQNPPAKPDFRTTLWKAMEMAHAGYGWEDLVVVLGLTEWEARKIVGLPERKVRT